MNANPTPASDPLDAENTPTVRVNGTLIELADRTPTGGQILAAAGLRPVANYALVRWPAGQGPTNEIGLEEVLALPGEGTPWEFFAAEADGISYFTLDEERYAWAGPLDEGLIRRIGRVAENQALWLERTDQPDRQLAPGEVVNLDRGGVERLYTRKLIWKLEVQGELTEWNDPQVLVRDAVVKAGIDPKKPWIIILKVKGQPKREVELTTTIDLSEPGIERLRLRPKDVTNGEGAQETRRDFSLLAKDAKFLDAAGFVWRTVIDGQRWLIVENYPLPPGYNVPVCRLAVDMPPDYPSAKLDRFYCDPPLRANGVDPPTTQHRKTIGGVPFQRWSRHRNSWSPETDSLSTHFALIEESIGREVGA
jgi:hypothetical protein